jgi:putative spermidine/putrescine transport system permease protein
VSSQRALPGIPAALSAAIPALFLLAIFVIPIIYLASMSFYASEAQVMTDTLSLENYQTLARRKLYHAAILRSFYIGALTAAIVVVCAYPIAYFLSRTQSRFKGVLTALVVAPLLASVVVRTYGWWVLLNRDGAVNGFLLWIKAISAPVDFLPSNGAIAVGLAHSLLPYGVMALFASINGINPRLEQAAMSLGATRSKTFWRVTLPLSAPGLAAAFILTFSLSIGAYATPAILGGPANETMATLLYNLMAVALDWPLGSALAVTLLISVLALAGLGALIGKRAAAK